MVNSALKLKDKLNNLSRRDSLGVFFESNKLKWSSLGQQTLEWEDRIQVLQLKKIAPDLSTSSQAVNWKLL